MEDVGIFYVHLVNFPAIWHILWLFGIFYPVWYIFTRFGMLYQEKSGNPAGRCGAVRYQPNSSSHNGTFLWWPTNDKDGMDMRERVRERLRERVRE
jgi:hypothetical protein